MTGPKDDKMNASSLIKSQNQGGKEKGRPLDQIEATQPQLIVKRSAVNQVFSALNFELLQDEEDQSGNCEFYRVVRIGDGLQGKVKVGELLVIRNDSGRLLKSYSDYTGEEHRLISETDILARTDF